MGQITATRNLVATKVVRHAGQWVHSLWLIYVIFWSGSTLVQVMACCLTAPSHYLNQCWLSAMRSPGIYLKAISQIQPQLLFTVKCLEIAYLKIILNLQGNNELTVHSSMVSHNSIVHSTWITKVRHWYNFELTEQVSCGMSVVSISIPLHNVVVGEYIGFSSSVRPSVRLSVDRFMSVL